MHALAADGNLRAAGNCSVTPMIAGANQPSST
jgi:hypothetical protein